MVHHGFEHRSRVKVVATTFQGRRKHVVQRTGLLTTTKGYNNGVFLVHTFYVITRTYIDIMVFRDGVVLPRFFWGFGALCLADAVLFHVVPLTGVG